MAKKTDNNAAFLEKFKECEQLIRQTYGDDKISSGLRIK